MKLEIRQTSVYKDSIAPTIYFLAKISTTQYLEYPHLITGELLCGGKVVSFLYPLLEDKNKFGARDISDVVRNENYREDRFYNFRFKLIAELDERKIDFIENERHKNNKKSVTLDLKLKVAGVSIPTTDEVNASKYTIETESLSERIEIRQDEWLQRFSPLLGIGEFYLVELIKPDTETNNQIWSDLYKNLVKNLNEMEETLKKGDWQRTMEISRRFFENIKIGDKKSGNKKYKDEFEKRMQALQFDEVGINNFLDGIWQFFEFTSKFIHEKSTDAESKPIPNARKEDAYFVYSLSVNLTNLVYEKLKVRN